MTVLFTVNPVNIIRTLSTALELAVSGVNTHMWRTTAICRCIAKEIGIHDIDQQQLLYASLLHDIGAASNFSERSAVQKAGLSNLNKTIYEHAEEGYLLLKNLSRFSSLAPIIRSHHDCWIGENPSGLLKESIPLESRIIHVADRIEVLIDNRKHILNQHNKITEYIRSGSGTVFDPTIVEAFIESSQRETFWLDLTNLNYYTNFFKTLELNEHHKLTVVETVQLAEALASLIDRMSSFTANHSRRVAEVAVVLAKYSGFNQEELLLIRLSGLLHDIGKLSVPNSILEKPGPLSKKERTFIRQHAYYTYRILDQIENFSQIAKWAAFHHETLDGKGYPFKLCKKYLPLGSRIMAVADIFVALAEDRPYRERLPEEKIRKEMNKLANKNKIDKDIVELLFKNFQEADNATFM